MSSTTEDPLHLANQICFAIYSAVHAVNKAYKPLLDELKITYPQYLTMMVLWEKDDLMVKEIGERVHLDSGTLTPLLKRLESGGLVRRQRCKDDERQVRITLTPKGRRLQERARAIPNHMLGCCGRSREELAAMRNELVKLRDTLLENLPG
jgi:DNA-binding MarR family transcriptional regulator